MAVDADLTRESIYIRELCPFLFDRLDNIDNWLVLPPKLVKSLIVINFEAIGAFGVIRECLLFVVITPACYFAYLA